MKEFKTVGDIMALIEELEASDNKWLSQYSHDLRKPRETGSTTHIGLEDVPRDVQVREVIRHKNVAEGCRCFVFDCKMGGLIGAIPFLRAYSERLPVMVRQGRHGQELWTPANVETGENQDRIYVIIGMHLGSEAVFTWHPGQPLGRLEDGIGPWTAVKIGK